MSQRIRSACQLALTTLLAIVTNAAGELLADALTREPQPPEPVLCLHSGQQTQPQPQGSYRCSERGRRCCEP